MAVTEPVLMTGTNTVNRMTAEEFLEFCSEEGVFELIHGRVVPLAPAGSNHSNIALKLGRLIDEYASYHDLGEVFGADGGFILEEDPSTVRAPDVAFVRIERIPEGDLPAGFFPGPPDFAVEVLSPTDSLRETEAKIDMYLRAGTTLAWILDPRDTTLRVYRPGQEVRRFGPKAEIDAEPLLPGFRCGVSKLFGQRSRRRNSSSSD